MYLRCFFHAVFCEVFIVSVYWIHLNSLSVQGMWSQHLLKKYKLWLTTQLLQFLGSKINVCSVSASICRSLLSVCCAWHLISLQSQSAHCAACYYKSRLTKLLFISIFRPQHYVSRGLVCQPGCVSPAVGGLQLWLQHDDIWRAAV